MFHTSQDALDREDRARTDRRHLVAALATALHKPEKASDLIDADAPIDRAALGLTATAATTDEERMEQIAAAGASFGGFFRDEAPDAAFGAFYSDARAAYVQRTQEEA